MRVAWHEVPGKLCQKAPSRRERYDRRLFPEVFVIEIAALPFENQYGRQCKEEVDMICDSAVQNASSISV
jgi:hypothetical protein